MTNPVKLKPNPNAPSIQQVQGNITSNTAILQTVRQIVQSLCGQSGNITSRAVTFDDLIALGLVTVTNGLATAASQASTSSSGSGGVTVTDGTTTVSDAATLSFDGATVTSGGTGTADIAVSTSGGFQPSPVFGYVEPVVPAASSFTFYNQQSDVTLSQPASGVLQLIAAAGHPSGSDQIQFVGFTPPAAPWTITSLASWYVTSGAYSFVSPIMIYCSSTGYLQFPRFEINRNLTDIDVYTSWTNYDTAAISGPALTTTFPNSVGVVRLVNNGTTLTWEYSNDGATFRTIGSYSVTEYMPAINKIGFGLGLNTNGLVALNIWNFDVTTP